MLYEILENVRPGEQITRNDTLMELKNSSAGAQPKIQRMIQEEEDPEKIGKYFEFKKRERKNIYIYICIYMDRRRIKMGQPYLQPMRMNDD